MGLKAKRALLAIGCVSFVGWLASTAFGKKPLPVAQPILVSSPYVFVEDRLQRNETLSHVFGRHNIGGQQLLAVLSVLRELRR